MMVAAPDLKRITILAGTNPIADLLTLDKPSGISVRENAGSVAIDLETETLRTTP
jgi:hypothetical protein